MSQEKILMRVKLEGFPEDDETLALLKAYAEKRGLKLATAARLLIRAALQKVQDLNTVSAV